MFKLEKKFIDPDVIRSGGLCLADWQEVPGFDLDNPDASAKLVLPDKIQAKSLNPHRIQSFKTDQQWSNNSGGFGVNLPVPARLAVAHWWGRAVGQQHQGIVNWLRDPRSMVSAHYVISPGIVTQLVPLNIPSWANGNTWANTNGITYELNPNDIVNTMKTFEELLAHQMVTGALTPNFELKGHQDFYGTECPGLYYQWLPTIRRNANNFEFKDEDMPTAKEIAEAVWGHQVTRPDGHSAPAWVEMGNISQRVIALYDGERPTASYDKHTAGLSLIMGDVAKRTIENYDRLAKVEASLEQIKSSLDKLNGKD